MTSFDGQRKNLQMSRTHFCSSSIVSEINKFKIIDFQKVGHGQSTIFVMLPFDNKCQNLQMFPQIASLALTVSEII